MKVVLAMVMSVDGRTTKWNNPNIYEWTSKEDQKHFFSLIEKYAVIIMGRKTFQEARSVMKFSPLKLRIVLTKTAKDYADMAIAGQLEFMDDSPAETRKKLETRGYKQALVVGGEHINALFFKAKLINSCYAKLSIIRYSNSAYAIYSSSKGDSPHREVLDFGTYRLVHPYARTIRLCVT